MSDTPRTDAFFYERNHEPSSKAMLKLAQILERELAAMTAERDALRAELHSALIESRGHLFRESCPEPSDTSERDPECPVCHRLTEIDAAIAASKDKP